MSSLSVNWYPRFLRCLVESKAFGSDPLSVIDVGARGGFEKHWSLYGDQAKLIGFEPDAAECERLNQEASGTKNCYFPFALHEDIGKKTFYITAFSASAGFCKPDMKFWHRFPDEVNLAVLKEIEIDTVDLDTFLCENNLKSIDFMKLDAEGAELAILKGAERALKKSVIGLSIEIAFYPVHEGRPLFSDLDSFLRNLGFLLFDLSLDRFSKKALPAPRWRGEEPAATRRGQMLAGQALYLRDGVNELSPEFPNALEDGWDDARIMKLASIMELFSLNDCAIELIQAARQKKFLQDRDADHLIDLLVPGAEERTFAGFGQIGGENISYADYLKKVGAFTSRGKPAKIFSGSLRQGMLFLRRFIPKPIRGVIRFCLIKIKNTIEGLFA